MRIMISPAKKMRKEEYGFSPEGLPLFLEQAETLKAVLQKMTYGELKTLWKCNDSIAEENVQRLLHMDLHRNLTPALFSYEGIQYQYMAPGVFETSQLSYVQEHLRILSGLYGLLRPFDGVALYRLEMQARLQVNGYKTLYQFWDRRIAEQLASETNLVLNLASEEYSKAVVPYLPDTVRLLTCTFGEKRNEKIVEKGTLCKMARGRMVRWLAEQGITDFERIPEFCELGYRFCPDHSTEKHYVFIKDPPRKG